MGSMFYTFLLNNLDFFFRFFINYGAQLKDEEINKVYFKLN